MQILSMRNIVQLHRLTLQLVDVRLSKGNMENIYNASCKDQSGPFVVPFVALQTRPPSLHSARTDRAKNLPFLSSQT
jgi:hypothetical protein